jgi:SulP family sulfate permease
VPLATLAAILFVVAFNMSEMRHFARMARRAPRADVAILVITFLLTVLTDLVVAVNIGVILATLQFLRRMASSVEVRQQGADHLQPELASHGLRQLPADLLVYAIEGPFFFGAVENFERALAQSHTDPRMLVLRLGRVPFIDITGIQTLEEVIGKWQRRGVRVMLCEANPRVRGKLAKAGLLQMLGEENYVDQFGAALRECRATAQQPAPHSLAAAAQRLVKTSEEFFRGGKH